MNPPSRTKKTIIRALKAAAVLLLMLLAFCCGVIVADSRWEKLAGDYVSLSHDLNAAEDADLTQVTGDHGYCFVTEKDEVVYIYAGSLSQIEFPIPLYKETKE
ncbi:hypothetical protein Rhal01_03697 [Rubritalea halochordaticola]|uniref:Uncharacterized protein n=1 Tax=Rubritalea halochordaticola TaxID=714537 RepID=A0ABP9V4B3_9BACT